MGRGRSKNTARRSTATLPKGIPQKKGRGGKPGGPSPFEHARATNSASRAKHHVHNRPLTGQQRPPGAEARPSALAKSIARRRTHLASQLAREGKANSFVDRRLGETTRAQRYDGPSREDVMLRRIVRERAGRSKRRAQFSLEEGDGGGDELGLTHRGKAIDASYDGAAADHRDVHLSDSDVDDDLDRADTALHFGGGRFDRLNAAERGAYGGGGAGDMGDAYRSRKEELEDRIRMKKMQKAEKLKRKEDQAETFDTLDDSFAELAQLLQFRDKEQERVKKAAARKEGTLGKDETEMDAWDKEMKGYLFERKVKATDRTKPPEEIAKDEADRLHALESKRLARMAGDFLSDDEFSDISGDERERAGGKRRRRGRNEKGGREGVRERKAPDGPSNPEEMSDSDDPGTPPEETREVRFTADGLVYVDGNGRVVGRVGAEDEEASGDDESDAGDSGEGSRGGAEEEEGDRFARRDGLGSSDDEASAASSDDGAVDAPDLKVQTGTGNKAVVNQKKKKAKLRAKETIPFVFEIPTTLDALHELIATHASTGADASIIIQRIHSTNSVRLDRRNKEKMQNFYDVLLKRFVAVGDAVFGGGDGGPNLGRYGQLDSLTKTLYAMSQDSPECAGAVWSRRLGIFQKALSTRLSTVQPLGDACEGEFTAWPSTGTLLLLRALPHIFPSTDKRHAVVTPALLLLGQILAQTPIKTRHDVVMGLFCAGLMLEYTKGAKRLPPEATAFLAGALRLFADDAETALAESPSPSLSNAFKCPQLKSLRDVLSDLNDCDAKEVRLSLDKTSIQSDTNALVILDSALCLSQQAFGIFGKSEKGSEREIFGEILKSLLLISGKRKDLSLPPSAKRRLAETARVASSTCASNTPRTPLQRRKAASIKELAIKTLAPRMEDPSKYRMSKDKGKTQLQAEHDVHRREYKREHKAAMRELRLDSAFIENERRKTKSKADDKAREKRHQNFAWLEQEQATMNQQVRLGGGLLSGGGIGAAKAAAKSGKHGIKKGGKF